MKRILLYIPLVVAGLVWACSSVPITGRKQFLLVSDDEMNSMALTSYKQFLDTNKDEIQTVVAKPELGLESIGFGETQNPSLETYADNIDTMAFLSVI